MNNFKQGDRVRRPTSEVGEPQGTVIGTWGGVWVAWDGDSPKVAQRADGAMLRPLPPTVREAAAAYLLAFDADVFPFSATTSAARDDLRAALAAEDVYSGDTPDPCPTCDAEEGSTPVRDAAAALADNVATDPGGVTDTQARLLDELRAAIAAEDGAT